MTELEKILKEKGYDTDKGPEYLENYQHYFGSLKENPVALLELGIHRGGSLLLWNDFFSKGTILGLDLHAVDLSDQSERIATCQGRQQDTELLDQFVEEHAPAGLDIVIDDASHFGEATKISFWHLYENHLKPGGIYVIEDWRTGYWGGWQDGSQYNLKKLGRPVRNRLQKKLDRILDLQIRNEKPGEKRTIKKRLLVRFRNLLSTKHFRSHNAGMVGFVKELVDELAVDAVTKSNRGYTGKQQSNKIKSIEYTAGQVFIIKPEE